MAEVKNQVKSAIDTVADKAKNATDWVADKSDQLRDSASDVVGTVHDRAVGTARNVVDTAIKTKDKLGEWVGESAGPAMEAVSGAACETRDAMKRIGNDVTHVIQKYPIAAVAIGFGIGMLLGRSVHRA